MTLWLTGLLALAHIFAQPDYPGTPASTPAWRRTSIALRRTSGAFLGVALSTHYGRRPLPLTDQARYGIGLALLALAAIIVAVVVQIRPIVPSFVMPPGRWTPFALWVTGLTIGAAAIWAIVGSIRRIRAKDPDPYARFFLLASMCGRSATSGS